MRKIFKICLSLMLALLMLGCVTACKEDTDVSDDDGEKEETVSVYTVKYQNINIELGKDAAGVLKKLGEPQSSNYVASCGENMGEQWVYSYASILVYTLKDDDSEIIDAVKLRDDTAATSKAIRIGADKNAVTEAYGDKYTEVNGRLLYTNGTYVIEFSIDEAQKVSGIEMRSETN